MKYRRKYAFKSDNIYKEILQVDQFYEFKCSFIFPLSQLIKNLESEREDLQKDLKLAESKSNEKRDEEKTEKLGTLLEDKG